MAGGPNLSTTPTTTFLAFLTDTQSIEAIKAYAVAHGWPEECVQQGGAMQAAAYLKDNKTPEFLLIEIPSVEEAPALLDQLAESCDPGVKLLVCGKVNEFSFYSWLMEIGAANYLLEPITAQALDGALKKCAASPAKPESQEKKQGAVVACMGARGGVGSTTILNNLAHLLALGSGKKIALLDVDPYFGTVAMGFDMEPTRELHTLFENPERIDGLFLDRIMLRINDSLHVLSAEEPLKENISNKTEAANVLLSRVREKYDYILIDMPRSMNPLTREILVQTDKMLVITEMTLLSLRDAMRMHDFFKDTLRKPLPLLIANRVGIAGKNEIPKADYEKHYGHPIDVSIPYVIEAFSASGEGDLLLKRSKHAPLIAAYHSLAALVTGQKPATPDAPKMKIPFSDKMLKRP